MDSMILQGHMIMIGVLYVRFSMHQTPSPGIVHFILNTEHRQTSPPCLPAPAADLGLVVNIPLRQTGELQIHPFKCQLEGVLLDELGHQTDDLIGGHIVLLPLEDEEVCVEDVDILGGVGDVGQHLALLLHGDAADGPAVLPAPALLVSHLRPGADVHRHDLLVTGSN